MSICKLPNIKCYRHADEYLGNEEIRNVLTRIQFFEILKKLHWHVWQGVQATISYKSSQRVFPGCSVQCQLTSTWQSLKDIFLTLPKKKKLGFKWWCPCSSTKGYLCKFDLHLQKKDKTEFGLGESVILSLSEKLDGLYDNLYFDNLFISSTLVNNLYEKWDNPKRQA